MGDLLSKFKNFITPQSSNEYAIFTNEEWDRIIFAANCAFLAHGGHGLYEAGGFSEDLTAAILGYTALASADKQVNSNNT